MVLVLPLGHEETVIRRLPWVTLTIIGACILLQVRAAFLEPPLERRLARLQEQITEIETRVVSATVYRGFGKPKNSRELEILEELAGAGSVASQRRAIVETSQQALEDFRAGRLTDPEDPRFVEYQQLKREAKAAEAAMPTNKLAYVPARDGLWRMLTSMFAHGGWLHLIGNMWFLYLLGCNLEDRWGRTGFLLFYLLSGIVAVLAFTRLHPAATHGLVGASGAVAGAMGAFGVCFARTRVRMFYLYWLMLQPRWGTFSVRAVFVVALWALQQFVMTLLEASATQQVRVAYSAHAGGFLFGVVVASLLRLTGADARLDAVLEEDQADAWEEDPVLVNALADLDAGRDRDALAGFMRLAEADPTHEQARRQIFLLALAHGEHGPRRPRPAGLPLVDGRPAAESEQVPWMAALDRSVPWLLARYQADGNPEALRDCYRDLRAHVPAYGLGEPELSWLVAAGQSLLDAALVVAATGELLRQYPASTLLPRALWTVAALQADAGREDLQRRTFQEILARFPTGSVADLVRRQAPELAAT